MPGRLDEQPRQYGAALLLGAQVGIQQDTAMHVALPRETTDSAGRPLPIPFVVNIGGVALHGDRAQIERLVALLDGALAAQAGAE